jgi:hypothetical protein
MEHVRFPPLISAMSRDPRARRQYFWSLTLKKDWPEIKHLFMPAIQYQDLADLTGVHLLLTQFNGNTFEMHQWFAPKNKSITEKRSFYLFDPEFTPLMKKEGRSVLFQEEDLPKEIQAWLESHMSNTRS